MSRPFLVANIDLAEQEIKKAVDQYNSGNLDPEGLAGRIQNELLDAATAGYRFAKGGLLNDVDVGAVNAFLGRQRGYLDGFVADMPGLSDAQVETRAVMYAGSVSTPQAMGAVAGTPEDGSITWDCQDDNASCEECPPLDGTYTRQDFEDLGVLPGQLDCLTNCRCVLS